MLTNTDPETAAETAKFIATGKTIVHQGRTFEIFNPPPDEDRADSPYILRSQQGKWYALTRNVNPKCLAQRLLFGVGLYGGNLKCLPGWFSDKTGELVSLG